MALIYIQLMKKFDLNEWDICNPDNRQDILPQPYRLINEVLHQTIFHKLSLNMHQIEQKKKDKNYQGSVKQFLSTNTIDVENIACLSSCSKHQNNLVAGDKNGNVYLLDLAKKVVFSKKQLCPSRRVIFISQTAINDGEVSITTIAVILNSHHKIYILRYKNGQPKLILTHQIEMTVDQNQPNKLPFQCHFDDYGRLLFVYAFDGSISLFKIPEVAIDLDQINKNQTIPLQEEQFKKKLRYPLNYAILNGEVVKINQKWLQIPFQGKKIPLSKEQMRAKMTKKVEAPPAQDVAKKDPKKKEEKKIQIEQPEAFKQQIQFNSNLKKKQLIIDNGQDNTPCYQIPKYRPFVYVIHSQIQLQKKKQFEKGKFIHISQKIIYGWTNTKQFRNALLLASKNYYYSNFQYIQHYLTKIPQKFTKQKNDYLSQKLAIKQPKTLKNIYEISATALSLPDERYFATGTINGSISIWSTSTLNIIMNTDKHQGGITNMVFFQNWKLVSGSSKGEVHIDNILKLNNEVKRTNIFESKVDIPISNIKISQLGIAFVLDINANLRVYDLWRNQKIAKVISCNNFALIQNKGKRWIPTQTIAPAVGIYSNNDFTVILSSNWPNFNSRELQQNQTKKNQINSLINNPWKCKGSNVHVVRNFQFLLSLFDGLENIYKKGYERKKVQNLFTNLEFTQLYDRNFDIPDFNVSNNGFKKGDKSQIGFGVGSKTHISSGKSAKSKQKTLKDSNSMSQMKSKLTNQVLHPQKFLLERRKIQKTEVITDQKLKAFIRDVYKKQGALQNTLQNDIAKGQF